MALRAGPKEAEAATKEGRAAARVFVPRDMGGLGIMSKATNQGMSRRSFIGMGAVAAMAAGAAGLAGCAPSGSSAGSSENTGASSAQATAQGGGASDVHIHNVTDTSWMTPPAEVTDFAKELTCDAVVCGHGFAGITACRELAEQGKKVILIEKQPEDTYAAVGNEFAALNAKILPGARRAAHRSGRVLPKLHEDYLQHAEPHARHEVRPEF